jgi:hypothetical protein
VVAGRGLCRADARGLPGISVRPFRRAYESGPTGFGVARELTAAGIRCVVAAPSKIRRAVGNRVNRRPTPTPTAHSRTDEYQSGWGLNRRGLSATTDTPRPVSDLCARRSRCGDACSSQDGLHLAKTFRAEQAALASASSGGREVLLDAIQPFAGEGSQQRRVLGEQEMPLFGREWRRSLAHTNRASGTGVGTRVAPAVRSGSGPDRRTGGRAAPGN